MKKVLATILLAIVPLPAFAIGGYFEGNIGYAVVDNAKVKSDITLVETGDVTGIGLRYDNAVSFGLELGIRDFEPHNVLRLGLAWDRFDADLDQARFSASGGTLLAPGNYWADGPGLEAGLGIDADNRVDVYTFNIYYDVPSAGPFDFYFGGGVGLGDIENAKDREFAWRLAVGVKYQFSQSAYLGLRLDHINVSAFEDELGLEYGSVGATRLGLSLGVNF